MCLQVLYSKLFIDARNTTEYNKGHIEDAISFPEDAIEKQLAHLDTSMVRRA